MTKYNKSEIMRNAHDRRRKYGATMSQALRDAWAQAKLVNRPTQKDALMAAFKAKYPGGTLKIHQFWRGATVQFTAGGKVYTYKNYGWQQKLGIAA